MKNNLLKLIYMAVLSASGLLLIGCGGGAVSAEKSSYDPNSGEYRRDDVRAGAVIDTQPKDAPHAYGPALYGKPVEARVMPVNKY